MASKFFVKKALNAQYYFVLTADNNEIILRSSETYITKQGCLNGIESVRINSPYDHRYYRGQTGLQYFFTLSSGNGEKIGVSEMYTSIQGRENGISAVKKCAPIAPIED
jgi:uncharacterized protein